MSLRSFDRMLGAHFFVRSRVSCVLLCWACLLGYMSTTEVNSTLLGAHLAVLFPLFGVLHLLARPSRVLAPRLCSCFLLSSGSALSLSLSRAPFCLLWRFPAVALPPAPACPRRLPFPPPCALPSLPLFLLLLRAVVLPWSRVPCSPVSPCPSLCLSWRCCCGLCVGRPRLLLLRSCSLPSLPLPVGGALFPCFVRRRFLCLLRLLCVRGLFALRVGVLRLLIVRLYRHLRGT